MGKSCVRCPPLNGRGKSGHKISSGSLQYAVIKYGWKHRGRMVHNGFCVYELNASVAHLAQRYDVCVLCVFGCEWCAASAGRLGSSWCGTFMLLSMMMLLKSRQPFKREGSIRPNREQCALGSVHFVAANPDKSQLQLARFTRPWTMRVQCTRLVAARS